MKKRVFSLFLALYMVFSLVSGITVSSLAAVPVDAAILDVANFYENIQTLTGKTKGYVTGISFIKASEAPSSYTPNSTLNFASTGTISGAIVKTGNYSDVVLYSSEDIYVTESLEAMFDGYSKLAKASFANFNTSNVTSMKGMFKGCTSLITLDLTSFDTSSVTDMSTMFSGCTGLKSVKLSSFNTGALTKMNNMFYNCSALTELDLSSFDTSGVTTANNFKTVFSGCTALLKLTTPKKLNASRNTAFPDGVILGYTSGGTSYDFDKLSGETPTSTTLYRKYSITYTDEAVLSLTPDSYYYGTGATLPDYSKEGFVGWYLTDDLEQSIVTSVSASESGNKAYTAKIEASAGAVYHTVTLNTLGGTINGGEITQYQEGMGATLPTDVTRDAYEFKGWYTAETGGEGPVTTIGTDANTDLTYYARWEAATPAADAVFDFAAMLDNLKTLTGKSSLAKKAVSSISFKKTFSTPSGYTADTSVNFASSGTIYGAYKLVGESYDIVFYSSGNILAPESLESAFEKYTGLTAVSFNNLDTSNTTNMSAMFKSCSALTSLDLTSLNTTNTTDMSDMFNGCTALTSINLSSFNTEKLENMSYIFKNCSALTSLDLSSFDTTNVSATGTFTGIISGCTGLLTLTTPKALNDSRTSSFSNDMVFAHLYGSNAEDYDKFSDALPVSTTLYRKFTLSYQDESSLDLTPTYYYYGKGCTLPDYSKTNEVFEGWYEFGDDSQTAVFAISGTDSGNKLFVAKWKPTVYHTVTLNTCGGTIVGETVTQYKEGIGAVLPSTVTKNGFAFLGWFTAEEGGEGPVSAIGTDASTDIVLYARWGERIVSAYSIEIQASGSGKVTADYDFAVALSTVTVTVTPDSGYSLEEIKVSLKFGGDVALTKIDADTYTFVMPSTFVVISATFVPDCNGDGCISEIYTDVDTSAWYHEYVDFVTSRGLMEGTSSTTFAPLKNADRAMIATILYRLEGKPAVTFETKFSDVKQGQWYTAAVIWAEKCGIFNGYANGTFGVSKAVTRQELAVILFRYASYKGYDTSSRADLSGFADSIPSWAMEEMQWAVAEGIIQGNPDKTLNGKGFAQRCQIAAIITRFVKAH